MERGNRGTHTDTHRDVCSHFHIQRHACMHYMLVYVQKCYELHVYIYIIIYIYLNFIYIVQVSGNELSRIRERILYLLGSLGGVVNAALLEREASGALMSHAVAWDTKNKLEFPVPYSDLKPTIFLGTCIVKFCDIY